MNVNPDIKTTTMADTGNHKGMRMWPSLETANRLSDLANIGLIGSLAVGVISTVLIVWMGGVKQTFWDTDRRHSREQVLQLDAGVAKANERADMATSAAETERVARLKLEAKLAPRRLSNEQISAMANVLSAWGNKPRVLMVMRLSESEAHDFASDIIGGIIAAGIVPAVNEMGSVLPPVYGVQVIDSPDGTLTKALQAAGVESATLSHAPGVIPEIRVGLKRP